MKKSSFTKKKITEYNEIYGMVPKDFEERLKWLFKEVNFSTKDIQILFSKLDEFANAEWKKVTYIFYMEPAYSSRPRTNDTFTFYVPDSANASEMFEEFINLHSNLVDVISTPCILETKAYAKTPKGMSKIEHIAAEFELLHNLNSPDWDNIGKFYCDMVQTALITNDSIVFKGEVEKFYSVLPRVEVELKYMTKYDCKFNKRTIEKRKSFRENPRANHNIDTIL